MRFLPAIILALPFALSAATLAYIDGAGRVVYQPDGGPARIAAKTGYELCLSPDGKRIVYTRDDTGQFRTLVLWDAETGKSRDLVGGRVRDARWSPDGTRIAFLSDVGDKWQVWMVPVTASGKPAPKVDPKAVVVASQEMWALIGWTPDSNAVISFDSDNVRWVTTTRTTQRSVALKDIYGQQFQNSSSDHLRLQPGNPDLLAVSANYADELKDAAKDEMGLTSGIFLYDLKARKRMVLLSTKIYGTDVEWSGDGMWLYFTRMDLLKVDSPRQIAVWRMHADGTALELVVGGASAAAVQ